MVLPDQLKSLKFLVVEDNAFTSMELCQMLRALGAFAIETASEGREALNKFDSMSSPPDVILVDLRMPGMGGTDLLDRLAERKFSGWVVICSGVDQKTLAAVEAQARDKGLKLGPRIAKPPSKKKLTSVLNEVFS